MRFYANCYEHSLPTLYSSEEYAKEYAYGEPYAVAVPVELPDPPAPPVVWSVGDWLWENGWKYRIVDICGEEFLAYTRVRSWPGEEYRTETLKRHVTYLDTKSKASPAYWYTDTPWKEQYEALT